jgi:glycolate oxidase subunit GlcD
MAERLLRDLAAQVSPTHALGRPADLAAYAFDAFGASGERHLPDAVVFPATTEEVASVILVCAHHDVPIIPRGAGTGYSGGAVPTARGGVIVNLARMSRILGVETEAMRMQVEAGVVTATIHHRAAQARLFYPPDPGSSSTSTIGGNVACNAAGAHALRYGVTADYLAGATAVLADGRILRVGEGGEGGHDLLRLLPASEGTLAIVTQAILRLLPAPQTRATIGAAYSSMEGATEAASRIAAAGLVPAALEVLDGAALDAIARSLADPVAPGAGALVIAELEGDATEVNAQVDTLRAALDGAGALDVHVAADEAEAKRLWAARKAISAAVARVMIGKVNEDVVVPRDRVAQCVEAARLAGEAEGVPVVTFGHLGDGNLHCTFLIDPRVAGDRARGDAAAHRLFEAVLAMSGSLTGEHGVGQVKLPFVERQLGTGTVALMRRIKAGLDPRGLLNPGKKLPEPAAPVAEPEAQVAAAATHQP